MRIAIASVMLMLFRAVLVGLVVFLIFKVHLLALETRWVRLFLTTQGATPPPDDSTPKMPPVEAAPTRRPSDVEAVRVPKPAAFVVETNNIDADRHHFRPIVARIEEVEARTDPASLEDNVVCDDDETIEDLQGPEAADAALLVESTDAGRTCDEEGAVLTQMETEEEEEARDANLLPDVVSGDEESCTSDRVDDATQEVESRPADPSKEPEADDNVVVECVDDTANATIAKSKKRRGGRKKPVEEYVTLEV